MPNIDEKGLLTGVLHLIKNGTFELKGSEVQLVNQMINWLDKDVRALIENKSKPKAAVKKKVIKKD